MKKNLYIYFIIILALVFSQINLNDNNVKALSTTIYVDIKNIDGPWSGTIEYPYKSIQEGIDNSLDNGTIFISNGIYYENIVLDKSLILTGEDKTNTIIDGSKDQNAVTIVVDNVTLYGLTMTNSSTGIHITNANNIVISNNTINNNNVGISTKNNSNNSYIYNNNFLENNQHISDEFLNYYYKDSIGNFWDTYNGSDENNDGIGDKPYSITEDKKDLYPLIQPLTIRPIADFTYSPSYPTTQDIVSFYDNSKDEDGYIKKWNWDFGDGINQSGKNATHQYEDNGVYNIVLLVVDNYGSETWITREITIFNEKPTSDFSINPENPTDIQIINFNDESYDLDGYITNWSWFFGDGNTSTLQNPEYQYSDNGDYLVELMITDDDGGTDRKSTTLKVYNVKPIASFTYITNNASINISEDIKFKYEATDLDGEIVYWKWNFGDGTNSSEENPIHSYSKPGAYSVKLIVEDDDGDVTVGEKTIKVSEWIRPFDLFGGFSPIDIGFFIFIIVMIAVVFYLSRRFK